MNDSEITVKRPLSITVICILGILGGILTILMLLSSIPEKIGAWYPPYLAVTALIGLVIVIGLWFMKKWAVYSYIGLAVTNQIVFIIMGVWNFMSIFIPLIVIVFLLKNISKMK